jgi:hypothetical protein
LLQVLLPRALVLRVWLPWVLMLRMLMLRVLVRIRLLLPCLPMMITVVTMRAPLRPLLRPLLLPLLQLLLLPTVVTATANAAVLGAGISSDGAGVFRPTTSRLPWMPKAAPAGAAAARRRPTSTCASPKWGKQGR